MSLPQNKRFAARRLLCLLLALAFGLVSAAVTAFAVHPPVWVWLALAAWCAGWCLFGRLPRRVQRLGLLAGSLVYLVGLFLCQRSFLAGARQFGAAVAASLNQRFNANLAATAGGTLTSKQKIKLEAYIQMNYLDRILRHANTRLMQMTAGQYELERIGAENQRSQSGLDLGVIDHYNGTRRSVKTLSGGESFKASLALALGLSDEVQSAAGGIRLDTLFLDEGFGSLDDESLEQAMRVLAGLTEGDRLVGIISHVGALQDRIDRQVVVHKARTGGSTVELIV